LFGNWCSRIVAPAGRFVLRTDALVRDSGQADTVAPWVTQTPVEDLPDSTLVYLLGSRYCETDQLSAVAWQLFGNGPTGWARVQAICDYVHQHIKFGYEHARRTRTAWEAHTERRGVCRDYAHLAIAFCRCMNIPARYCTGYLGDIHIPAVPAPMDFAGWFEAYLGDAWYTFDARNNTPRIGRILMARGRDACEPARTQHAAAVYRLGRRGCAGGGHSQRALQLAALVTICRHIYRTLFARAVDEAAPLL
jgi:transglutaminase-like putative cysteine protease